MSDYIVSARKYRPKKFDEVVGQDHITTTLRNAIKQNQIAHAFLFCGPRGVGKTTCARILARTVNCENITPAGEACGSCSSCKVFDTQTSFNIIELDAASHNSVEHIRTLNEQVRFQPQQGKYKVFIIDEVHMLSTSAFNAFLKTLEEPPPYALFILATTEKHKIIPTILSRCQIFDFKRIQIPEMIGHLKQICKAEGIEGEDDALHIIAQKADGALRDCLTIFDRLASFGDGQIRYRDVIQNLSVLDYDYHFKFVESFLSEDMPSVMKLFDEVLHQGFDPEIFVSGLSEHFRNLLICTDQSMEGLMETGEQLTKRYREQAKLCSRSFILSGINVLNQCGIEFMRAQNKRLHVEVALLKVCYLNRTILPGQNTGRLEENQKKKDPKPDSADPEEERDILKKDPDTPDEVIEVISPRPKVAPMLSDLMRIEKEILTGEKNARSNAKPLTIETIESIWQQYSESVDSQSLKNVLKSATLGLKQKTITCVVNSEVSKEMIQQEIRLVDRIRKEIHDKKLLIEILVDAEEVSNKNKDRLLTNKEKFESLVQTNPLVRDLTERFDLKVDHDI